MAEFNYVARKKFKANGKQYVPGDVWEPEGGKHDAALIRHYLILKPAEEPAEEPKPKPTRSKASGTRSK